MRYIKTYEDNIRYNIGDYVIWYSFDCDNYLPGLIVDKIIRNDSTRYFVVNEITKNGLVGLKDNVSYHRIKRKMTKEEIDDIKLKVNMNKYNL